MKTKQIIPALWLLLANAFIFVASAQNSDDKCNAYFPTTKGAVLEYVVHDIKNGSNKGVIRQTVMEVVDTADGLKIIAKSERIDKNERPDQKGTYSASGEIEMRCKDGIFYADVRSLLDSKTSMYKGGDKKLSAVDLQLPARMSPGQLLPDAELTIGAETAGLPIPPIIISVVNRKVTALESVTVAAGTFECYKIECELEMTPVVNSYGRLVQWIAAGVGTLQSETYDEDGRLISKLQLTKWKE